MNFGVSDTIIASNIKQVKSSILANGGFLIASPNGYTGAQGPTGDSGIQSLYGATGAKGSDGVISTYGVTGPQGMPGQNSLYGATGMQGNVGSTSMYGSTGAQGVKGADALTGAQGKDGPQGVISTFGATGIQGNTGAMLPGPSGSVGPTGASSIGSTGSTGMTGTSSTLIGPTGSVGQTGFQGINTSFGATGPRGNDMQGPTGVAGTSGLASNSNNRIYSLPVLVDSTYLYSSGVDTLVRWDTANVIENAGGKRLTFDADKSTWRFNTTGIFMVIATVKMNVSAHDADGPLTLQLTITGNSSSSNYTKTETQQIIGTPQFGFPPSIQIVGLFRVTDSYVGSPYVVRFLQTNATQYSYFQSGQLIIAGPL